MSEEKPFEERWEEIETELKTYLDKINANVKKPERVDQILQIGYNDMQKLGYEECGENSYLLRCQATYLQQEYNYHKSKYDWCDSILAYLLAKYWTGDNFVKRDDKAARLAINNTAIQSLLKMLYTSKTYMTSLDSLAIHMDKMADSLEKLQFSKRKLS